MKFKIQNRYFILFLLFAIIILRLPLLIDISKLLYFFLIDLITNFSSALGQFDFSLADNFISLMLIFAGSVLLLFNKKKNTILEEEITFTSSVLIILIFFFVFAPVISTSAPDFQSNIGITKLLQPFSSVEFIHTSDEKNGENEFNSLKKKLMNENLIYIDSIRKINDEFYYYQKEKTVLADKNKIIFKNNIPLVESRLFVLGTDEFGRDVFSRLIYGTRISMIVGLGAVIVSFILGIGLGFLSGYSGWFMDTALNRFTDMFLSLPVIFLIILILTFFGNSIFTIIFILGFSGWMSLFKIVRGEVISIKQKDYFITASMIGLPGWKLLSKEILPVILAPVIVNLVFQYGNVILAEAALSYLGLGTALNYPSWGGMIESGQEYLSQAWWMIFFPGLALILTLFTANNLGRQLNKYFNPRINE